MEIGIENMGIEKIGIDNYSVLGKRVVHKKYGADKINNLAFLGPRSVAYVKFDSLEEEVIVAEDELMPEIKNPEPDIGNVRKKELEEMRTGALKEVEKIAGMNNETLIETFEYIIRRGVGPVYPGIVFLKREILKRMNNGK